MKDFLKLPKTKTLLIILCSVLVLLLTFGFGIAVGYRRAIFSSEFGQHYYHNLYGDPFDRPMGGVMGPGPKVMHGVVGQIIDVTSSTLSVKDLAGNEVSVLIMTSTPIREMDGVISEEDMKSGDTVTVIGEPNASGQVVARFIRVFEASSSLPGQN